MPHRSTPWLIALLATLFLLVRPAASRADDSGQKIEFTEERAWQNIRGKQKFELEYRGLWGQYSTGAKDGPEEHSHGTASKIGCAGACGSDAGRV